MHGLLRTFINSLKRHYTSKRQKRKIDIYSCIEVFVTSGYFSLLLNQEYMLFVIKINFYVPIFQLSQGRRYKQGTRGPVSDQDLFCIVGKNVV